jgi:hypothetical protein
MDTGGGKRRERSTFAFYTPAGSVERAKMRKKKSFDKIAASKDASPILPRETTRRRQE